MRRVKDKEKCSRILSKLLYVLTQISKVGCIVVTICIIPIVVALPMVINEVNVVSNNNIVLNIAGEKIEYVKADDETYIVTNNHKSEITEIEDIKTVEIVANIFRNYSKERIKLFLIIPLIYVVASISILYMILTYIGKFFKNLADKPKPFIKENSTLLTKTGKLMLIAFIIDLLFGSIISLIIKVPDFSITSYNLIEIAIIFIMAYVFDYGYNEEAPKKEVKKEVKKRVTKKTTKKKDK